MKIRPLVDRVVVRPDDPEKMTPGGLYIPDNAQKKSKFGTVLAVGPGPLTNDGRRVPLGIEEGDRVLYRDWDNEEIKEMDGAIILSTDNILGIVQ